MQNSLEAKWAQTIIDQLIKDHHDYFCISPGSRSTPLILAIASHKKARSFIHYDERSLAFHALGYSKVSKKAPVIVVTSGTACGNLLPAIMESYESSCPMIILTADRPLELQDAGANQTTRYQSSLYKNFVCYELNLPSPEEKCLENLRQLVHRSSYLLQKHKKSIHINCSFREPFDLDFSEDYWNASSVCSYQLPTIMPSCLAQELANFINQAKKGAILLGSDALKHQNQTSLQYLTQQLKWPIFSDALSLWKKDEYTISYYDLLVKQHFDNSGLIEELSFDCILHIGGSFVSKHLPLFLKRRRPKIYIHVHTTDHRYDPTHLVTHKLESETDPFCKELILFLESKEKNSIWFELDVIIKGYLSTFFIQSQKNAEANFFWLLSDNLPKDCSIYIGNSMPIRDLSALFHPEFFEWTVYANRGLSGIDGNIATATGIVQAISKPLIVIIGDQTFLHDATSLSHIKKLKSPIKLIVLNNSGGQIFSHLPINQRKTICEKYFINNHKFNMIFLARAFDVPFYSFPCVQDFIRSSALLHAPESCLIEIQTDASHNLTVHHQLSSVLQDAISSLLFTYK